MNPAEEDGSQPSDDHRGALKTGLSTSNLYYSIIILSGLALGCLSRVRGARGSPTAALISALT